MTRKGLLAIGLTISVLAAVFLGAKILANPPGVEGIIVTVDSAEKRIHVMRDRTDYWFSCTPNTTITLNGYAATFDQLAVDQRAKVAYDPYSFEAIRVDAMPR
jgi:hypothetical protein